MCQSKVIQDSNKEDSLQMSLLPLLLHDRQEAKSSLLTAQSITDILPIWLVNPLFRSLTVLDPQPASLFSVHLPPPSIRNDPSRPVLSSLV